MGISQERGDAKLEGKLGIIQEAIEEIDLSQRTGYTLF